MIAINPGGSHAPSFPSRLGHGSRSGARDAFRERETQASCGGTSVPKKTPTAQYLEKAAAGDLFEVESGKLATQKGGSDEVKQFGRMMTEDHTASTEKIKQAVAKSAGGKAPSAKLTSEQEAEMKRLMSAEKGQFDKLYIDAQRRLIGRRWSCIVPTLRPETIRH